MLESLMKRLSDDMEIDPALFNTTTVGTYQIVVDGNTKIKLMETNPGFWIECAIAANPSRDKEVFYTEALLGNLFGQGTYGATVGLNDNASFVVLTRQVTHNLTYNAFKVMLEDFFNAIDFWRNEIAAAEKGQLKI